MEDFQACHFFFSRTCVRETKAGFSSRTPKVHPNDKLCARFRKSSVTCAGGFHFVFLVFSKTNLTSVQFLDCGNSLPLWIAARLVSLSGRTTSPYRFDISGLQRTSCRYRFHDPPHHMSHVYIHSMSPIMSYTALSLIQKSGYQSVHVRPYSLSEITIKKTKCVR